VSPPRTRNVEFPHAFLDALREAAEELDIGVGGMESAATNPRGRAPAAAMCSVDRGRIPSDLSRGGTCGDVRLLVDDVRRHDEVVVAHSTTATSWPRADRLPAVEIRERISDRSALADVGDRVTGEWMGFGVRRSGLSP